MSSTEKQPLVENDENEQLHDVILDGDNGSGAASYGTLHKPRWVGITTSFSFLFVWCSKYVYDHVLFTCVVHARHGSCSIHTVYIMHILHAHNTG